MASPPPGRREQAKTERRNAILDATLSLIDESDAEREYVSVETIARAAGVAPATVYNLFGSRDAVLRHLVRRMAAETVLAAPSAPAERPHPLHSLLMPLDLVCAQFKERPHAWSHVILQLGDIAAATPSGESSGREFIALVAAQWSDAQSRGVIDAAFSPAVLGLQTYATGSGSLMQWAAGRISLDTLQLLLRHTILLIAAATSTESFEHAFAEELRATGTLLASCLS